jgi:hypothetical protein
MVWVVPSITVTISSSAIVLVIPVQVNPGMKHDRFPNLAECESGWCKGVGGMTHSPPYACRSEMTIVTGCIKVRDSEVCLLIITAPELEAGNTSEVFPLARTYMPPPDVPLTSVEQFGSPNEKAESLVWGRSSKLR